MGGVFEIRTHINPLTGVNFSQLFCYNAKYQRKESREAEMSDNHEHGHTHTHEHFHEHTHVDESGREYTHTHVHGDGSHHHEHGHVHSAEHTKSVLNRMSRIIGHMESTKRMVEDGRDCSEVLIQLSAIESAIKSVSRVILKEHMSTCIIDAVKHDDLDTIEELNKAIDKFIR